MAQPQYWATSTTVYSASQGAINATVPATLSAGDLLIRYIASKPGGVAPAVPLGWNTLGTFTSSGAGVATAADVGPMSLTVHWKIAEAEDVGTTQAISVSNNTALWVQTAGVRKHTTTRSDPTWTMIPTAIFGQDNTGGTAWSAALGTIHLQVDDLTTGALAVPTDVTTPSQFTAETFSASGFTFGTMTEITEPDSTTGGGIGGATFRQYVTAGSGTATVTMTATASGTTTNVYGPAVLVRTREYKTELATPAHASASAVTSKVMTLGGEIDGHPDAIPPKFRDNEGAPGVLGYYDDVWSTAPALVSANGGTALSVESVPTGTVCGVRLNSNNATPYMRYSIDFCFTSAIAVAQEMMHVRDAAGLKRGSILMTTSGGNTVVRTRGGGDVALTGWTTATPVTLGEWYRIETAVETDTATTGKMKSRLTRLSDMALLAEGEHTALDEGTATTMGYAPFGKISATGVVGLVFDNIFFDNAAYAYPDVRAGVRQIASATASASAVTSQQGTAVTTEGTATAVASATEVTLKVATQVGTASAVAAASSTSLKVATKTATATAVASASAVSVEVSARTGTASAVASATAVSLKRATQARTGTTVASAAETHASIRTKASTALAIATATAVRATIRLKSSVATAHAVASALSAKVTARLGTATAVASASRLTQSVRTSTGTASAHASASEVHQQTLLIVTAGTATAHASASATTLVVRTSTGTATAKGASAETHTSVRAKTATATAVASTSRTSRKVGVRTGTATALVTATRTGASVRGKTSTATAVTAASGLSVKTALISGTATAHATASSVHYNVGVLRTITGTATAKAQASHVKTHLAMTSRVAVAKATASRTGASSHVTTGIAVLGRPTIGVGQGWPRW